MEPYITVSRMVATESGTAWTPPALNSTVVETRTVSLPFDTAMGFSFVQKRSSPMAAMINPRRNMFFFMASPGYRKVMGRCFRGFFVTTLRQHENSRPAADDNRAAGHPPPEMAFGLF